MNKSRSGAKITELFVPVMTPLNVVRGGAS